MKYRTYLSVSVIGVALLLSACDQGDERLQEKAQIEADENAKRQIEQENLNRVEWIEKAESELELRHRFYDAISGTFEGVVTGNGTSFIIRFRVSPSRPSYPDSDRTRTLEEVTEEINNLFVNVHVTEWSEGGVAFGCVFERIRPDMTKGTIALFSEECKRSFQIGFIPELSEIDLDNLPTAKPEECKEIASDLRSGRNLELNAFSGVLQASLGASLYKFYVDRVTDSVEEER